MLQSINTCIHVYNKSIHVCYNHLKIISDTVYTVRLYATYRHIFELKAINIL